MDADVRDQIHQIAIEYRDIDQVGTKKGIGAAIRSQFGIEITISLRNSCEDTLAPSAESAKKFPEADRVKIDCVIGYINILEYGHLGRNCKSREGCSNLCRRCGVNGHIAKNCYEKHHVCSAERNGKRKSVCVLSLTQPSPVVSLCL